MNNIKTRKDVLAWAKMILAGKGEKYTPLGKADMFAIAKYVAYGYENLTEDLEVNDMPPPKDPGADPQTEKPSMDKVAAVGIADEEPSIEEVQPTVGGATSTTGGPATTKVTMTRGYAFHKEGLSAQAAYDKFLKWSMEHPKERMVMDFSTGVKSTNAAFAYWLMANIVVEEPTYKVVAYN